MDFLKNSDDEDMFPYWGAVASADSEDVNYQQFFITSREEQLMQTPLTSLVSDLSSSQLVGALAAQPAGVDSNFSGAFTIWLPNKSSIDVCEDQRGKCTRKRMFSWIMDNFRHLERKMKLTRTYSASSSDAGSAAAPPEQAVPKVEQSQPDVHEKAYHIPPLIQTRVASHNHMIAERNRRFRERQLKTVLMSCIPAGNMKKKDKNSVYQYAIEYIKQLQHHIAMLQQQQNSVKEPGQEASSCGLDEEVNKSCETSLHSMTPQEDGSTIRLSFDTSSRKMQPSLSAIIDMLNCLRGLGFEVGSINWKPETSSILAVTVHSTMNSSPVSAGQLRETLEQKLFPARSFAA